MVHVCLHVLCMFAEGASALSLAALRMVIPPQGRPFGTGGALSLLRRVGVEHPWNPWDTYST